MRRRHVVLRALSVLVSVCSAVSLTSSPADAVDVANWRGDAGSAALFPAWMDAFSIAGQEFRLVGAGGGIVLESPRYAHRSQWVCMTTRFQRLKRIAGRPDRWKQIHQGTQCGRIAASEVAVGLGGPQVPAAPFARYRTVVRIRWRLVQDGPVIGMLRFDFDRRRDFRCATGNPDFGCRVGYSNDADSAFITSTFR
jgi:hypothetical protein